MLQSTEEKGERSLSCRRGITEQPSAGSTPGLQGPRCSWTNLPVPLSGYLGLSLPGKGHDDSMHAASTSSFRCHPSPKSARTSAYPGLVAAWLCLPRVRLQSAALTQRDESLPQNEDGSLCLCSLTIPSVMVWGCRQPQPRWSSVGRAPAPRHRLSKLSVADHVSLHPASRLFPYSSRCQPISFVKH